MKIFEYIILLMSIGGLLLVLLDFNAIISNQYFPVIGYALITLAVIGTHFYAKEKRRNEKVS